MRRHTFDPLGVVNYSSDFNFTPRTVPPSVQTGGHSSSGHLRKVTIDT